MCPVLVNKYVFFGAHRKPTLWTIMSFRTDRERKRSHGTMLVDSGHALWVWHSHSARARLGPRLFSGEVQLVHRPALSLLCAEGWGRLHSFSLCVSPWQDTRLTLERWPCRQINPNLAPAPRPADHTDCPVLKDSLEVLAVHISKHTS